MKLSNYFKVMGGEDWELLVKRPSLTAGLAGGMDVKNSAYSLMFVKSYIGQSYGQPTIGRCQRRLGSCRCCNS